MIDIEGISHPNYFDSWRDCLRHAQLSACLELGDQRAAPDATIYKTLVTASADHLHAVPARKWLELAQLPAPGM